MMPEFEKLKERDRALCLMAATRGGEDPSVLLKHLPEARAADLQGVLTGLQGKSDHERRLELQAMTEDLQGKGKTSLFYHADPAWISETFKGESAQVISLVLQEVPKAKVGGVLKDLSKETRKALKHLSVTQAPQSLRDFLKKKFESRFPAIRVEGLLEKDEVLKKLSHLSMNKFDLLLRELGIAEMAVAFSKIHRAAVRAILNRLNMEDAKELRRRMKRDSRISVQQQREAQLHILSLDFEKLEPEEITKEIGFGVFSKAFGRADREVALYFVYQFPPRQGYLLKRYVDQNIATNTLDKVRRVREQILDAYTRVY
jgi:hypothetical protein